MAKQDDLFAPPTEIELSNDDLFAPPSELELAQEDEAPSTLETVARGAGQGATMGFLDELMASLKASGGASPSQVVADPKKAMQKEREMMKSYEQELAKEREATQKVREASPILSTGLEIAGGIAPALLTGGASVAGNLAKAATQGGMKQAAKESAKLGGKFGAVSALGESQADTPLDLAQDVALGAGLGAGLGAATPVAAEIGSKALAGVKKAPDVLRELIPGAEAIGLGYKAGKQGIKLSEEGIRGAVKDYSEKLHKTIVTKLSKEGMSKKKAIELADDIGLRINAGEPIESMLEELAEKGAMGVTDLKEKAAFFKVLDDLKTGNNKELEAIKKLEVKAAKAAAKDKVRFGSEVETTREITEDLGELLPLPEQQGKIKGLQTKNIMKTPEGDVVPFTREFFQEIIDSPVKLKQLDIANMQPSQANELVQYLNSFAGDLSKPSKNITERNARRVASEIKEIINKTLESPELSGANQTMTNMFRALEKFGIKDKVGGSTKITQDQIDQIRKKLAATGESAEIDKERVFEYLRKAGLSSEAEQGEFINKLSGLAGMTEGVRTTNIRGLLGTAEGAVAKGANIAGQVSRKVEGAISPITSPVKNIANKVAQMPEDSLVRASKSMVNSPNQGIQALGKQLEFALQQEGPIKNAAIWSLSQQPAFREAIRQSAGEEAEDEFTDLMGTEPLNIPASSDMQEDEVSGRSPQGVSQNYLNKEEVIENPTTVEDVYNNIAEKYKGILTKEDIAEFGGVESLHNKLKDSKSGAKGLFQFTGTTRNTLKNRLEKKGITIPEDVYDLKGQQMLMEEILDEYIKQAKMLTGKEKLDTRDMYLIHNIGYSEAKEFLSGLQQDPDAQVSELLTESSINNNPSFYKGKTFREAYNLIDKTMSNKPKFKFSNDKTQSGEPQGVEEQQTVSIEQLQNLQDRLNAHSKYVNSGGTAVYSATGERLMESVNQLDLPDEVKQEAEDAIVDGDIQKLRQMLDSLKTL
jgi:hypothetical protein